MRYRVAATILEKIDNPAEALPACRLCLEELHSTQMIQGRFFQESIIRSDVRDVNSFICDVTQIVSGGGALLPGLVLVVMVRKSILCMTER